MVLVISVPAPPLPFLISLRQPRSRTSRSSSSSSELRYLGPPSVGEEADVGRGQASKLDFGTRGLEVLSDRSEGVGRVSRRGDVVDDPTLARNLLVSAVLLGEGDVDEEESGEELVVAFLQLGVGAGAVLPKVVDAREGFGAVADEGLLAGVLPKKGREREVSATRGAISMYASPSSPLPPLSSVPLPRPLSTGTDL